MHARPPYDAITRILHLLLVVLGIAAIVSGQFAGDVRRAAHPGFDVHQWLGLGMAGAVVLRFVWGVIGPRAVRFSAWLPVTGPRLALVAEDLRSLAALKLPERAGHDGLAGAVQAFGLLGFLWMAATGAVLFTFIEPGSRTGGWLRAVQELHEGGQVAVLGYIAVHAVAVVAHSVAGAPVWRRMFAPRGY